MPRTKEQNDQIREKTRSLLLKCSLELFADQGYNGTSMADIAKRAGVSKGLAYSYFKSKQEILEKLTEELLVNKFTIFAEIFSGINEQNTSYGKLLYTIDKSFEFITSNEKSLRLYMRLFLQSGILDDTQEMVDKLQEQIVRVYEDYNNMFKDLGYDDPEMEVYFFSTMINGMCFEYLSQGKEYPLEKMKEKIIERYNLKRESKLR